MAVKIINIIGAIILVTGVVGFSMYPIIYWFYHDSLTMMQLFKTTWKILLLFFVLKPIGYIILKIDYLR